jgi:hypothetical protein
MKGGPLSFGGRRTFSGKRNGPPHWRRRRRTPIIMNTLTEPDKMAPRKMITDAELKAAIKTRGGVLSLAAADLGVTRQTVHGRVQASEELQAFVREVEAEVLDAAEGVIMTSIEKGDGPMARWFLERKGRERGYGTRTETEHRIADDQLEAIVASLGGDIEALTALKAALES